MPALRIRISSADIKEKQYDNTAIRTHTNIIKIEGSVELAPLLGLADGIVDIVETGSTLKENGLEVVEEIFPISARVIVNMASMKLRKDEIEAFLVAMEKASKA